MCVRMFAIQYVNVVNVNLKRHFYKYANNSSTYVASSRVDDGSGAMLGAEAG